MQKKSHEILEQAPVGIITFSETGEIDYINQNFRKFGILYSFETQSLIGVDVFAVDIFPYISIHEELHQLLLGTPFEREIKQITTNEGKQIDLIVKGSPMYDKQNIIGGILLIEDLKVLAETKEKQELKSEYFERAIRHVNDVFIVTNANGDVQFAAGSSLKNLNVADKNLIGENIMDLFEGESRSILLANIDKVILSEEPVKFEFVLKQRNHKSNFSCKIEPILNKRGSLKFLFYFFNNITADVSEKSRLSKKVNELYYYKSITDNLNNALFTLDRNGRIIYWNEQSEKLFGLSSKEVLGKFFGNTLELFDKRFFENIKKDLEKEKIWKVNLNIFGKEHQKDIFEAKFSYLDKKRRMMVVLCTNITRRVSEEEELNLKGAMYENMLTYTEELICKLDKKGNFVYVNKTFLDRLGYEEKEILQKNFNELIQPSFFENNIFDLNSLDQTEASSGINLPLVTKEKKQFSSSVTFVPIRERGRHLKYLCYIKELVKEDKKDAPEELYAVMFNSSLDGIAVEEDGRVVVANDSFAEMFGYENGESLVNKDLLDLVSNDDILKVAEYFRLKERGKSAPDRFEFLGKKQDDSQFFTELSVSTFESNSKNYVVMVARDITERKRAQKVIRESEEKYRNITENIEDFLYTFERAGKYMRPLFYTSAVNQITGYNQAEFLEDSKLMLKIIHPDDLTNVRKNLSRLMKSSNKSSGEMEFRIINKQGNVVWVRNKINFTRNEKGEIQKVYGLVSDITFKKRAEGELKKSTDELVKLNETKDRFISIVSHDLRTPFSSILGFTDLLANDDELTEDERKQYVNYIQESSKSMLSLVNSLLDWTRLQTGRIKFEPERIDAKLLVEKIIRSMSGAAMQKGIEIFSTVGTNKFIFGDNNLVSQVFSNILSNAIKFTSRGDKITISVNSESSMRFLEFSISDTGRGIKEEDINKLFNVDKKHTSEGTAGEKGSGLGLSLVKEIVEKHGGTIWAESEYGKGSTFKFTLPVASVNILLVDDDKTDRILYTKILKNITPDYTIDVASNGEEALSKIKSLSSALVITDHAMPKMDGYKLVKEMIQKELLSKTPVIILSSALNRNIIQDYTDLGIEFVFQKPVNLRNLKQAVEKSLKKSITSNKKITSLDKQTT
jgi:PAS domain S-box-containing protein